MVCQTSQRRQAEQADDERAGAAHGVRLDQRAEAPPGQQLRLVRRHLEALRGLEDHGAEGQRGEDAHAADDGGGDCSTVVAGPGQQLTPDQEAPARRPRPR